MRHRPVEASIVGDAIDESWRVEDSQLNCRLVLWRVGRGLGRPRHQRVNSVDIPGNG